MATYGFIGAGVRNDVRGLAAAIIGGSGNQVSSAGTYGFVGGGENNQVQAASSAILGGNNNTVSHDRAVVIAGDTYPSHGDDTTNLGGRLFINDVRLGPTSCDISQLVWNSVTDEVLRKPLEFQCELEATGGIDISENDVVTIAPGGGVRTLLNDRWEWANNQDTRPSVSTRDYPKVTCDDSRNSYLASLSGTSPATTITIYKYDTRGNSLFDSTNPPRITGITAPGAAILEFEIDTDGSELFIIGGFQTDLEFINNGAVTGVNDLDLTATSSTSTLNGKVIFIAKLGNNGIWQWSTKIVPRDPVVQGPANSFLLEPAIVADRQGSLYVSFQGNVFNTSQTDNPVQFAGGQVEFYDAGKSTRNERLTLAVIDQFSDNGPDAFSGFMGFAKIDTSGAGKWSAKLLSVAGDLQRTRITTDGQNIYVGYGVTDLNNTVRYYPSTSNLPNPVLSQTWDARTQESDTYFSDNNLDEVGIAKYTSDGTAVVWSIKLEVSGGIDKVNRRVYLDSLTTDIRGSLIISGVFSAPTLSFYNANDAPYDLAGNVFPEDQDGTPNANLTLTKKSAIGTIYDTFVAKYSKDGLGEWSNIIQTNGDAQVGGSAMDTDFCGQIYIFSLFTGTANFFNVSDDKAVAVPFLSVTSTGSRDGVVAKFSPQGEVLLTMRQGNSSQQTGTAICTNRFGEIFIAGEFIANDLLFIDRTVDGASVASTDVLVELDNSGGSDAFIAKIANEAVSADILGLVQSIMGNTVCVGFGGTVSYTKSVLTPGFTYYIDNFGNLTDSNVDGTLRSVGIACDSSFIIWSPGISPCFSSVVTGTGLVKNDQLFNNAGTNLEIRTGGLAQSPFKSVIALKLKRDITENRTRSLALDYTPDGFLTVDQPDGATGGDNRGENAIDLQKKRKIPSEVASGNFSTLLGGQDNTARGSHSAVVGGYCNIAGETGGSTGMGAFIGGGEFNKAYANCSAIVGGTGNMTMGDGCFIGGGFNNICGGSGEASFLGAGRFNEAKGLNSVVAGGSGNKIDISSAHSSILGGRNSSITGSKNSAIISGAAVITSSNYTLSFCGNATNANDALVLGRESYVGGKYGIAIGRKSQANLYSLSIGYRAGLGTTSAGAVFIGTRAGESSASGARTTVVGGNSGQSLTTGIGNTLVGSTSGYYINSGNYNCCFGTLAGTKIPTGITKGSYNCFFGKEAGGSVTSGSYNICLGLSSDTISSNTSNLVAIGRDSRGHNDTVSIGRNAGNGNISGSSECVWIGYNSGKSTVSGPRNIGIGENTGTGLTSGSENILIGRKAGQSLSTGTNNTILGSYAGNNLQVGSFNILIGDRMNTASNGTTNLVAIGRYSQGHDNTVSIGRYAGFGSTTSSTSCVWIGYNSGKNAIPSSNHVGIGRNTGSSILGGGRNTMVGDNAGSALTNGWAHTLIGSNAGSGGTFTGWGNVVVGSSSGTSITSGGYNVILGYLAGLNLTTGSGNVCIGQSANTLSSYTSSSVAIGYNASAGTRTVSIGRNAGRSSSATSGIFIGEGAGYSSVSGADNICIGRDVGTLLTYGYSNTIIGALSGTSMTAASRNTIIGRGSAPNMTVSQFNTVVGHGSLTALTGAGGWYNTVIGSNSANSITTGATNIVIGFNSGGPNLTNQNNVTCIGIQAGAGCVNNDWWFRVPNMVSATAFHINTATGQVGPVTSSLKYKKDIQDLESEITIKFIEEARPVRFKWKRTNSDGLGFIAEEMNEIIPEVVPKDKNNEPASINYEHLVPVLTKIIQDLRQRIITLESQVDKLLNQ